MMDDLARESKRLVEALEKHLETSTRLSSVAAEIGYLGTTQLTRDAVKIVEGVRGFLETSLKEERERSAWIAKMNGKGQ